MAALTTLCDEASKRAVQQTEKEKEEETTMCSPTTTVSKTTQKNTAAVTAITALDVYCGRDKRTHAHPGNKRFRDLITANRERYQTANLREQKTQITAEIIQAVKKSGGRFLKFNEDTAEWYEVDAAYCHDKVSHALRSAKDPDRPKLYRRRPVKIEEPTAEEEEAFRRILAAQEECYQELMNTQNKTAATFHIR